MKIRHKIFLSFLSIFTLMCAVTVTTYLATQKVDYFRKHTALLENKLLATTNLRGQVRNQLLETYEVGFVEGLAHESDLINEKNLVQQKIDLFKKSTQNEVRPETYRSVLDEYQKLNNNLAKVIQLIHENKHKEAKKTLLNTRQNSFNDGFNKHISGLIESQNKETIESNLQLENSIKHLQQMLIALSFFTLIMIIIFVIYISKSIGLRLLELENATNKISQGNYDVKLTEQGSDEISILAMAFNKMVSALMANNKKLIMQQEILTHTSKLSALGEMAGGIAHEINTPLAAIILNAELIEMQNSDSTEPSSEITEHSQAIINIGGRIGKIIMGLRGFSRDARDDDKENFPIRQLIAMTTDLCNEKFKMNGVEIILEKDFLDIKINGQLVQLSQTLLNLLNNSFDAIHGLKTKWIRISMTLDDHNIGIKVTDSGTGLSPQIVEKIFTPFFTTKEIGYGTGLGLSISKKIVEHHNGNLTYDFTSPNTCFIIQLPRIKQEIII